MTNRQWKVLQFVRQNPGASIYKIGEACGISSSSVIRYNIDALVEKGLLSRSPHKKGTIYPISFLNSRGERWSLIYLDNERDMV